MADMRIITGPYLDSLQEPANGVFVVSASSPTVSGSAYVFMAPYIVQIANGQAYLRDGVTPWSLPVTGEGQAFEIIQRILPGGSVEAANVRTIDTRRVVAVPAGTTPIAYSLLPDVVPVQNDGEFVEPPWIADVTQKYLDTVAARNAAQAAQAAAEQAASEAGGLNMTQVSPGIWQFA